MHEVIFDDTLRQGKEILEKAEPGTYKDTLSDTLHDVELRWNEVVQRATERQDQLEEVTPPAQEYSETVENFVPSLIEMEEIVSDCNEVLCEKHSLVRERALIKVLGQSTQSWVRQIVTTNRVRQNNYHSRTQILRRHVWFALDEHSRKFYITLISCSIL